VEFSKVEIAIEMAKCKNGSFLFKDARALTRAHCLFVVAVQSMFLANKEMSFSFLTGALKTPCSKSISMPRCSPTWVAVW